MIANKNLCLQRAAGPFGPGRMAEAVRVIVRCRPINEREKKLNCKVGTLALRFPLTLYSLWQNICWKKAFLFENTVCPVFDMC